MQACGKKSGNPLQIWNIWNRLIKSLFNSYAWAYYLDGVHILDVLVYALVVIKEGLVD